MSEVEVDRYYAEIWVTGQIMGAFMTSQIDLSYDYECVGYPIPGATNVIRLTSKANPERMFELTVRCV